MHRTIEPTILYFGGDDVPVRIGVPNFLTEPRVRGSLVAVSAFYLALGPGLVEQHAANPLATPVRNLLAEIRTRGRPAGRVGYSIYLFELPPRDKRQGERSTG